MCLIHKWEKWEQYDKETPARTISSRWMVSACTDHMQKRRCKKCGKEQRQKVCQTVH